MMEASADVALKSLWSFPCPLPFHIWKEYPKDLSGGKATCGRSLSPQRSMFKVVQSGMRAGINFYCVKPSRFRIYLIRQWAKISKFILGVTWREGSQRCGADGKVCGNFS